MYWEIINYVSAEKPKVLEKEVYDRMFYSVLPFRVWSHLWTCCGSQFDPNFCQFCTKLQIKDKKVTKEINKKLTLDTRNFLPPCLYYGVVYNSSISLFVHVEFGPDRERPYSANNYGVLYYEVINSPFMIFKAYLDILGKIILNQCDKYLLPALFANQNFRECGRSTTFVSNCFSMKMKQIRRRTLIFEVKLIKLLAVQAAQVVNSRFIRECYYTYNLWDHYHNPYLSIDRPKKRRK